MCTYSVVSVGNVTDPHPGFPPIVEINDVAVDEAPTYDLYDGFCDFAAGLSVGFCGVAAGFAIVDEAPTYDLYDGFCDFAAGLSVGFCGVAAGFAIGVVGDAGVRGTAQQPKLFVGMVLILIFGEVLGLYGLIIALILNTAH
eukprot:sb/3474150/